MKTVQIATHGSPEVLRVCDVPIPEPGPGQALVRIEASGVNFIDTYFREGRYAAPLPYILGQEAAGTVAFVGSEVTGLLEGTRVAWCGIPGTYAEYAVVAADRLVVLPEGLSTTEAAAAMLQGMTAHYLAHATFTPRATDTVLIHAGAGGTGLLLIQIVKKLGARVLTTVSTDQKAALAYTAGADEVILYSRESVRDRVRELTDGIGVAVVYDSVGKTTFEESLQCLSPRGMLVLFGGASGAVPPFDLIRLSAMGSLYITRPTLKDYIASREDLEMRSGEVFGWIAGGSLKLRIEHSYALAEAAHAHLDLESRKTTGKLLLFP